MKKHKLRISQCMIVKNEEKNIERALSWGKSIMYEQIVVDTGSTDRTVELAKAMGAKVYYFEWINDFSAAKNFAISKAKGDWIAFLDADEYLTEEWAKKLPTLLEQLEGSPYYAIRSMLADINEAGKITSVVRHCRFFKRLPGLEYGNAIHEVLRYQGKALGNQHMIDAENEFPVYHTGYTKTEMKEKNKKVRNQELLLKELEKNPENYHLMGYLGDSCFDGSEDGLIEAEKWYRKAIELIPSVIHMKDERSAVTFIHYMMILSEHKQETELMEFYKTAIQKMPWVYDIDYVIGSFYLKKRDYEKAILYYEKAIKTTEQYGADAYGMHLYGNIEGFYEKLIVCYYQIKDFVSCIRYSVSFLSENKHNITILTILLKCLEKEKVEDVLIFLRKLYNIQNAEDRILLIRACLRANMPQMLEAIKKECTQEELELLEQVKTDE